MSTSDQQERRRHENRCMSILVDLGVTYRRTLGDSVAWAFFSASAVTPKVATRIMSAERQRRLTDWERQVQYLSDLRRRHLEIGAAG